MHKRGLDGWRSNSSLTHELEKVDLDSAGSYRLCSHSYTIVIRYPSGRRNFTLPPSKWFQCSWLAVLCALGCMTYFSRDVLYRLRQPSIWYDMEVKPKTSRFNRRPPPHLIRSSPQIKPPVSFILVLVGSLEY